MIQAKTVSKYYETDFTRFTDFHKLLAKLFPKTFEVCKYEEFHGNMLLKWEGKTSDAPVMFMHHHDVVDADGGWQYGGFSGEIANGKVWGRGTLDTKGGLFCVLQAVEEKIASGFIPQSDIYIESSCNEECDSSGADYISEELARRGIKMRFIMDEGGFMVDTPLGIGQGVYAMIGLGEKGCESIKFIARSHGGHSSTPAKNSPIARLSKFVCAVEKTHAFKKNIPAATKEMFKCMSVGMKQPLKFVLGHPTLFGGLLKLVVPKASPTGNALIRSTVAFTMCKGSDAHNSIPSEAYVVANLRFSHYQGRKSCLRVLKKYADKYDLKMDIMDMGFESKISPVNTKELQIVKQAILNSFPGVIPTPFVTNSASDSRYMSRISENCYRFTPFFATKEQIASIHGTDENVDINGLAPAVDFYKYIIGEC